MVRLEARAAAARPRLEIDSVATTATSQPPLMPSASEGFVSLTVKAVKIA